MKPEEYSQPRRYKLSPKGASRGLKRERNILLDIPERPKHLTGDDFAELEKNKYYNTEDKRSLSTVFAEMEKDHLDFLEKNHYGSQIDMYRSYNKKNSYYTSNRVGFFETFYRYIRNKIFRRTIDNY